MALRDGRVSSVVHCYHWSRYEEMWPIRAQHEVRVEPMRSEDDHSTR